MAGDTLAELARNQKAPGTAAGADQYDILMLDAEWRIAVTITRSLGRAGLRVALGLSAGHNSSRYEPPSFRSRYCARTVDLPDYTGDSAPFIDAILAFVREHRVRVLLPVADS